MLWRGGSKVEEKDKGVTIKINGEPKLYAEKKDTPIISENAEAAAQESSDESFDWVLPNEITPSSVPKKVKKIYPHQRRKIQLKTPIILAIVAVVVGTSLGLLVIQTITSEQIVSEPVDQGVPAAAPVTEPTTPTTAEGNMTVQTFLVQGGVFSTEESAKEVQALIHEKNLPAQLFQIDKNYYIFLGVAENLEGAKELALNYKTHDVDVFWKEVDVPTKLQEGNQDAEKILSAYSSLAELSAAQLRHAQSSVEASRVKAQLNEVKSSEYKQSLNEVADLLQNDKSSEAQEKLLTFLQDIAK